MDANEHESCYCVNTAFPGRADTGRFRLGDCRVYPFEAKMTEEESNQFIGRGE